MCKQTKRITDTKLSMCIAAPLNWTVCLPLQHQPSLLSPLFMSYSITDHIKQVAWPSGFSWVKQIKSISKRQTGSLWSLLFECSQPRHFVGLQLGSSYLHLLNHASLKKLLSPVSLLAQVQSRNTNGLHTASPDDTAFLKPLYPLFNHSFQVNHLFLARLLTILPQTQVSLLYCKTLQGLAIVNTLERTFVSNLREEVDLYPETCV